MTLFRSLFANAMHSDLNVAEAIGEVNSNLSTLLALKFDSAAVPSWSDEETSKFLQNPSLGLVDFFADVDDVLGVLSLEAPKATTSDIGVFIGITPDANVEALLRERRDARASKDFKKSDAIRDQLAGMGYAIKDAPGGKVEVTRK